MSSDSAPPLSLTDRFISVSSATFSTSAPGISSATEFRAQHDKKRIERELEEKEEKSKKKLKREEERKKFHSKLSFAEDIEESENEEIYQKISKDPTVATEFLRDAEREAAEKNLKLELESNWVADQEKIKAEKISIIFSYWDGSGHREAIEIQKKSSILEFLEAARLKLSPKFRELKNVSSSALIFVKEDLILPHSSTFYEYLITKARGKSGPLFDFGVHEDVRILADATKEKTETHAGKVMTKSFYEKNKHIFPYNRYEKYEIGKDYKKYSVK